VTGPLSSSDLSSWINYADCGLSTTPFNIIDKSSSALAFVDHGLPVIVMDPGSPVRGIDYCQQDLTPDFWLFGDPRLETFECMPPRHASMPRKDRVVQQFIEDLQLYQCGVSTVSES
jgi:hypothetical protein